MADIVVNGNTSGAVTLSAPAVAGTVTVTLPAASGTMLTTASSTGISGSAISSGTVPEAYGGTGTSTGYYGFKNRIINGAMAIDQRKAGASVAVSNTDSYFGIDRYSVIDYSNAATWQQLTTSPPAGFQYFGCLKRNSATSGASILAITQVVESNNCFDLQSQSVTLSFWAKAGANFSAASSNMTASVQTGTGTNQSAAAFRAGTWTGQATTVTSTFAITTSWVKYTITGTVSATATQIGVQFQFTSVGTAGADDSLNVTGVQLEKGSTATSFDYRPYGTELQLCQRYYETTSYPNAGQDITSTQVSILWSTSFSTGQKYLVAKRAAPTITLYGRTGVAGAPTRTDTGAAITGTSTASNIGATGYWSAGLGQVLTAYSTFAVEIGYTASAEL